MAEAKNKYAVVTGANKGIGLETVKQLASKGIKVVLTARDEKRGLEAVEKLKASGLFDSDLVIFHQLDVVDSTSIDSFAHFIKTQFGKLDILVNNAGVIGTKWDFDALMASGFGKDNLHVDWNKIATESYESSEECLKTNYYGAKMMCETLIPLLLLSDSPKIVNVSSSASSLKYLPEPARKVLSDVENLTEERMQEVLNDYLKDYKEGSIESKGWSPSMSAYALSKAAMNAYTRILAKRYQNVCINCVCPGFVKTDMNLNTGTLSVEEGAESLVRLALIPDSGPSGLFFVQKEHSPF